MNYFANFLKEDEENTKRVPKDISNLAAATTKESSIATDASIPAHPVAPNIFSGFQNELANESSPSASASLPSVLTKDMILEEEREGWIIIPGNIRINSTKCILGMRIGTDGVTNVYLLDIANMPGQKPTAVFKQFIVQLVMKQEDKMLIANDFKILSQINHENIVKVFGAVGDPEAKDAAGNRMGVGIVMEYCENGSVHSFMIDNPNLDMSFIIKILYGASKGIEHLHNHPPKPIVHGNIKSENILIDNDFNAKICDFGMSKLRQATMEATKGDGIVGGALAYKAPETFEGIVECASDVYSFGCVILEMLTGERPWNRFGNNVAAIIANATSFKKPHDLSKVRKDANDELVELMKRCLDYDKEKRPTMNEVRIELEKMMNNAVLIELDYKSDEYNKVERLFFPGNNKEGSLNRDNTRIAKVEKIRHHFAERRYDAELSNIKSILNDNDANEKLLFHGTSLTDPMKILNHPDAFMKDYSTEGFYGKGLYFAEKARYVNVEYQYNIPNTNQYQLLICSVICGRTLDFGKTVSEMTRDTNLLSLEGEYESVHGGPHRPFIEGPSNDDSNIYVVYKDTQVVARYLITYANIYE